MTVNSTNEKPEERISWIWHRGGRWHAQVVLKTPSGPKLVHTTKPTLEEINRWYSEQRAKKHGE